MNRPNTSIRSFWRVSPLALWMMTVLPAAFANIFAAIKWDWRVPVLVLTWIGSLEAFALAVVTWRYTLRRRARRGDTPVLPCEDNLVWVVLFAFGIPLSDTGVAIAESHAHFSGFSSGVLHIGCLTAALGIVYAGYQTIARWWQSSRGSPTPSVPTP